MDALKHIATVIFVSLIFYGVITMLLPEKGKGKLKNIIGIAIIASIILSVKNVDFSVYKWSADFETHKTDSEKIVETVYLTEQMAVVSAVEGVIKTSLETADVPFERVSVFTDISFDGGISIIKAEVVLQGETAEKAKLSIGDLGFKIDYIERTSE